MASVKITADDVKKIAVLSRLQLTDDEIEKFTGQLSNILEYVGKLEEVNTDGIEIAGQVTGLSHVLRKDEVIPYSGVDQLLTFTKYPVVDNQVLVKKIM